MPSFCGPGLGFLGGHVDVMVAGLISGAAQPIGMKEKKSD